MSVEIFQILFSAIVSLLAAAMKKQFYYEQ
jgi:hypothetical protein